MQPNPNAIYEVNITGGAQIGFFKASWPFAKLFVTRDRLQLNGGIIGNLVFKPSDILSVETTSYNGLSSGIRINHNVGNYKSKVIFTTTSNVNNLLNDIRMTGFLINRDAIPKQTEQEIEDLQQSGAFPLKASAAIFVAVIWNLCLLPNYIPAFLGKEPFISLNVSVRGALIFLLSFVFCVSFVKPIQQMVLKPGRTAKDIKLFLIFIAVLATLMLIGSSVIPALVDR